MSTAYQKAIFGGGCFWCTEAVFQQLQGVIEVLPGYSGGQTPHPTYEDVCTGTTGHAEAVQISFDPTLITYDELLDVFFHTHDPTSLNRQGNDVGTQYRSIIFYHDQSQRESAESYKRQLDESGLFSKPVVTEITPYTVFYPAESYHHNYFARNPGQGYCQVVIRPKLQKFTEKYGSKLKPIPRTGH